MPVLVQQKRKSSQNFLNLQRTRCFESMNRIAVIVIVTGIVRVKVIAIVRVMALPARCAVRRRKEKTTPAVYRSRGCYVYRSWSPGYHN